MTRVRKAVIPAAGLGTRFLPATKSSPKEMLPVVDKPAIQYVVEEAVQGRAHRHPDHHRSQQARDRGPLRPQLRARALPRQRGQARPLEGSAVRVRPRRHPLRPPARSARSRARGVGRASSRRQRAVRGAARRRPHGRRRRAAAFDARRARAPRPVVSSRSSEVSPEEISSYGCIDPDAERGRATGLPTMSSRSAASSRSRRATRRRRTSRSSVATCSRPRSSRCSTASSRAAAASCSSPTRSRCCSSTQSVFGVPLPARSLRRRAEDRLPAGERRARARPRRPRSGVRRMAARVRRRPLAGVTAPRVIRVVA